jgi:pyrimidine-nucleoside phosphorylase
MRAVDVIRKKRDGGELTADEIASFVRGATTGDGWADYQLSALLMATFLRGMSPVETATLTRCMTDSGKRLDLSDIPGPKVDKHSTGGVGDKTSLILGPLAAACGVIVPMMSGRGLGHSGGTLDKLESIPGFRVNLSEDEFRTALRKVGLGMIGQTNDIAPADKKLYALRDVTGTVECIPLITASILSKKLAEGINGLVMDVKCGRGAFMKTRADAKALAESLVRVGNANGLRVEAVITSMDAPIGRAVGNANEVGECLTVLKGDGPEDLTDLSVLLAAKMVRLAGLAITHDEAEEKVRAALTSGAALAKFRQTVSQQGGNPKEIEREAFTQRWKHTMTVKTTRPGWVTAIDAEKVGTAAMILGAGRQTAEDSIDHTVGVHVVTLVGERAIPNSAIFSVFYNDESKLAEALPLLESAFSLDPKNRPTPTPLVLEEIA